MGTRLTVQNVFKSWLIYIYGLVDIPYISRTTYLYAFVHILIPITYSGSNLPGGIFKWGKCFIPHYFINATTVMEIYEFYSIIWIILMFERGYLPRWYYLPILFFSTGIRT